MAQEIIRVINGYDPHNPRTMMHPATMNEADIVIGVQSDGTTHVLKNREGTVDSILAIQHDMTPYEPEPDPEPTEAPLPGDLVSVCAALHNQGIKAKELIEVLALAGDQLISERQILQESSDTYFRIARAARELGVTG